MRKILSIAAITCILLGCNQREQATAPREFVDTTITVRFGETAAIPNTNMSILFDRNIVDNRLPSGIQVQWWSNTAQLGMTVMPTGQNMQFYISGEIIDSSGVSFFGSPVHLGDFEYQILTLNPLPIDEQHRVPDSELVATILVAKSTKTVQPNSSFFPVAIGNRWIYADTVFQEGVAIATSVDTFTITDSYADVYGEWWVLSRWFRPFYGGELMVRHDTVFTRESGEYYPQSGFPFSYASTQLVSPQGDSSGFYMIYQGDMSCTRTVKRLDSAVVTPCGSFDGSWEFRGGVPSPEVMGMDILRPGIGFVFMQLELYYWYPNLPMRTHRMWLTEYLINK